MASIEVGSQSRVELLYPKASSRDFAYQVVGAVSMGEIPTEISMRGGAPTDEEIVADLTDIADYPSRFTDFTGKVTVLPISTRNPWADGSNIRNLLFREQPQIK